MIIGRHVLLAAAAVSFGIGALPVGGLNWMSLGLMFVTLSWLVP